eukprot:6781584-Heterocapsa_arctica.AAC.1
MQIITLGVGLSVQKPEKTSGRICKRQADTMFPRTDFNIFWVAVYQSSNRTKKSDRVGGPQAHAMFPERWLAGNYRQHTSFQVLFTTEQASQK